MSLFNRCFRIESKKFQVRISAKGDILFSEWSSRFVNVIRMGKYRAVWMVNMSNKLMAASPAVDFASKFNEYRRSFLAQRCCNKGGRYVAVVEYGGRRKVGAVMVPEGKNSNGWQILNRVFLHVVSCVRSTNLSVNHVDSSSIRPEVSFAKVVLAPAVVNGEGGRSSALVQNFGVAETSRNLHATEAANVTFPKLISSSMSKEKAAVGKCPAGLSEKESSFTRADLWKQVMSLQKEVDRLAILLCQLNQGGFYVKDLSCSVCGFTLKAQKDMALPQHHDFLLGSEYGLKSGGPKYGEGDLGLEGLGEELGWAEDAMESHYADQGGVDDFVVAQGGLGVSFNSYGSHTKLAEMSPGLSVVVGGISSGSLASELPANGQLLESKCLGLLQVPSPKLSASVGDLPTGSPASELHSSDKMQVPKELDQMVSPLSFSLASLQSVLAVDQSTMEVGIVGVSLAPEGSLADGLLVLPLPLAPVSSQLLVGGSTQHSEVLGAVSCISPMEERSTFELNRLFAEVGEPSGYANSDWVLSLVSSVRQVVGVSCGGHEE
ncbi:hypothetical protein CJ030_MR3G009543 [Morella rubra]|uniref:Uncharacterized protein n=1 Tax=Morella rubra TaxID=262757 RepID=A0A6A1W3V8_9ROSI|nr:hypothetical protein CJ030_MR3G009543 [Morella rubra]